MSTKALMPGFRVWLKYGDVVIGEGLYELLEGIGASGSISQAAARMKMSYRQAWDKIRRTEKRIGVCLISAKAGGRMGGGTHLTPEGEDLLRRYGRFRSEVAASVNQSFQKNFHDMSLWGDPPTSAQG
ncbi:MAG TPA: LysR family transcriptional regulator [Firmicutes bacterium]|nr:LysR family transcriptional regulator [Bacillota bacterium]